MTAIRPLPRCVPPAYSPVPWAALRATACDYLSRHDPRPAFAQFLCDRYAAGNAQLFASGTQALAAAISAADRVIDGRRGAGTRNAVALPAYGCFDIAAAAVAAGVRIVLYDIEPDTLSPDPDTLAMAVVAGARIVVVAPLYGQPVDWAAVEHCCSPYDAIVIEDAAQGHGATWKDRPVGSSGRFSVLSFGRGKGWTGGAGGALLTRGATEMRSTETVRSADEIGALLRAAAQCALGDPLMFAVPSAMPWLHIGQTRYNPAGPPAAMARASVRLLERSLAAAEHETAIRRNNAGALVAALAGLAVERVPAHPHAVRPVPEGKPGYLRFPVRISQGWRGFADPARARRSGIAPAYPATLADLPAVRERLTLPSGVWRWPGAETLVRELVTLPTHSLVTNGDREETIDVLRAVRA
jgi:perosamine synthetase